jgi:hypothetical protein
LEHYSLIELTNAVKVTTSRRRITLKGRSWRPTNRRHGVQFQKCVHSSLITNVNGPADKMLVKTNDSYVCFPDATGLLALAFIEIGGESNLAYEAAVTKAGYVSLEEVAYQDYYKSNLPKVFGKSVLVGGTRGKATQECYRELKRTRILNQAWDFNRTS